MTQLSSIDLTSFLIIKILGSGGAKFDLANEFHCTECRENKAQTWCLGATVRLQAASSWRLHLSSKKCDPIQHVALQGLKSGVAQPKAKIKYEENIIKRIVNSITSIKGYFLLISVTFGRKIYFQFISSISGPKNKKQMIE